MSNKAIILLSGGIDSTTTLAIARKEGYRLFALSFNYGQKHGIEIQKAKEISESFNVEKQIFVDIDLKKIGGSALTEDLISVPKNRDMSDLSEIPVTYVPARNTIFLSLAIAWGEVIEAENIFFGANILDYSGYPDCRPEYIRAFEIMANLGTKAGIEGRLKFKIHTPLISMTKGEIIKTGINLGIDYKKTHSCYDPSQNGKSCGKCDSCQIRKNGFVDAGISDPTEYY